MSMPPNEFFFLVAGMMDVTSPDLTDPPEVELRKRMQALVKQHHQSGRRIPGSRRR